MSWRQRLARLGPAVRFADPALEGRIATTELELRLRLPDELRSLLLESDGLVDRYGTAVVWTVADLPRHNREFRSEPAFRELYMPFDALLFFGEAGNGDRFFYRILDGELRYPDVYVWLHETDSRTWRAPTLAAFLERQLATLDGG